MFDIILVLHHLTQLTYCYSLKHHNSGNISPLPQASAIGLGEYNYNYMECYNIIIIILKTTQFCLIGMLFVKYLIINSVTLQLSLVIIISLI